MTRHLALTIAVAALTVAATACGSHPDERPANPAPVAASDLPALLLSARDINPIMGTTGLVALTPTTTPGDHRNLLSNLNCLGIWQVGEAAIYGDSGFTAIRGQVLRQPDTDQWDTRVVESAAIYPSTDGARAFLSASADRWSKCTNHRFNLTVNDGPRTTWMFGELTRTDNGLTMPYVRGENERLCQRDLSVANNVVVDVVACSHGATDQAATIADKITARVAR